MAGPGGGSRGGGFGGGSFGGGSSGGFGGGSFGGGSSGGFGGGSFGGGPRHTGGFGGPHHHGPHFHGRRYRVGGGFGGGCFSVVFVLLFVAFALFWMFMPSSEVTINLGDDTSFYDEATMQDYANEKYGEHFGSSSAYEDNILLVFLTNEAADGYYTIAWVGDNIDYDINSMFGEYSEYGQSLQNNINAYYAYSLDSDLARTIEDMANNISAMNLESSFMSESDHSALTKSKFQNLTALELNGDVLEKALGDFTEKTGIPCVLVIDSAEKVFNIAESDNEQAQTPSATSEIPVSKVLLGAFVLLAIIVVVAVIFSRKKKKPTEQKSDKDKMPWEG